MQQPRDYRVRDATAGGVVSTNDDVLIGGLSNKEPKSNDTSPVAQFTLELNWKQSIHHEHPPGSESLVVKSEQGLNPIII